LGVIARNQGEKMSNITLQLDGDAAAAAVALILIEWWPV